jgi:hypothetical protein
MQKPPIYKALSWSLVSKMPIIKVNSTATNRNCIKFDECTPYPKEDSLID